MKTKILLLTCLLSSGAFANVAEVAQGHVADIGSFLDNLENTLISAPQSRAALDLSDYQTARSVLIEQIAEASTEFKQCVLEVATIASDEISTLDSAILDLRQDNESRNSPAIARLIEDKVYARKNTVEHLEKVSTVRYQNCLKELISLKNKFSLIISFRTTAKRKLIRFSHILLPIGLITEGMLFSMRGNYQPQQLPTPSYVYSNLFGEETTTREQGHRRAVRKNLIDRVNRNRVRELFSSCHSSACFYLISADFISWFEQVFELNKDLELFSGLTLKELDLPFNKRRFERKVKRILNKTIRSMVRG